MNHTVEYIFYNSVLGNILLIAFSNALCGLYFEGQKDYPKVLNGHHNEKNPILMEAHKQLKLYFDKKSTTFNVKLDIRMGTIFQIQVWHALMSIPYGSTVSYKQLSIKLQMPKATRAVANAIAKNPISIIIPCHRIIGSDGSLTGYAAGLERKKQLLELESHEV